jgi:hypothetical protein
MDAPKDDFKWFGEGFDGFPKRLPDDCVEYSLFVIGSKLKSQKELLLRLEAVRKEALKLAESLLKEYIWQRDGFKVEVETGKGMSLRLIGHSSLVLTPIRLDVPSWPYKLWRFS